MKSINVSNLTGGSAYFIGIGGMGMSSLARVLKHRGFFVHGSDQKSSATTEALENEGIKVHLDQSKPHFESHDFIVYSSAIPDSHPEGVAAREAGLQFFHRAQVLSALFNESKTAIAVTGTHGKTTTSSMVSHILESLHKHPTCVIGGDILGYGTNAILGDSGVLVAEVDESDKTHELYRPHYAILTNLEEDHMENYGGIEDLEESFKKYLQQATNPGLVVACGDDERVRRVVEDLIGPVLTYGQSDNNDYYAQNIKFDSYGCSYELFESGFYVGEVRLGVPGIHNVLNSLGAIAVLLQMGIDFEEILPHLETFKGAKRRLEIMCQNDDLTVIDDYAHHPTEVKMSVDALKRMGKHVTVVFQPHRFSRTRYFSKEFAAALGGADQLVLTDIYAADELSEDLGSEVIYQHLLQEEKEHVAVIEKRKLFEYLHGRIPTGGVLAFLGAGDIGDFANEYTNRLKSSA